MSNFYVNLCLLIIVFLGMIFLLYKTPNFKKNNIIIVVSLVVFWTLMYMQKNSPVNKSMIKDELGKWIWPIIASLYQLTQVATRIPYGKLSQKLKSRNNIIQIAFLIVLISLAMMIISNFETWSFIIAAIAMGQFGATFGLDAQYISENYNIKKVFTSSSITFIVPVIGSLMASTIYGNSGFVKNGSFDQNVYHWMIYVTLILGIVALVLYSFIKEDKASIHLDNVDPSAQVFVKRGKKDIAAVSITAGLLAFTYNFILSLNVVLGDGHSYLLSIISVMGLGASALVGLMLKKIVDGRFIRRLALLMLSISTCMIGILLIMNAMSLTAWVILMIAASIAFGLYVMALFGAALHFDHKYPALVLGIFLTVKSFGLGSSTLAAGLIVTATKEHATIGAITIAVSIIGVLLTLIASMFIVNRFKDNDMDKLIDDSFEYENNSNKEYENSSKVVISN